MIRPTTLEGAKDVLEQYSGDECCIIYAQLDHNKHDYWLVETMDVEHCIELNDLLKYSLGSTCSCDQYYGIVREHHSPTAIVHIPELIMLQLINDGFVHISMSDKEWSVQIALGTAPVYRSYLIPREVA